MAKLQGSARTDGKIIIKDTSQYEAPSYLAPGTFIRKPPQ